MDLDLNADFDRAIAYCLGLVMNGCEECAPDMAQAVATLVDAKAQYNYHPES